MAKWDRADRAVFVCSPWMRCSLEVSSTRPGCVASRYGTGGIDILQGGGGRVPRDQGSGVC